MPHYAFKLGERYLAGRTRMNPFLLLFLCERLMFTPVFQVLSLFFLSVFEVCEIARIYYAEKYINLKTFESKIHSHSVLQGKSLQEALNNLIKMYWPVLKANWAYRSLPVFISIRYVSPNVSNIEMKLLYFISNSSI